MSQPRLCGPRPAGLTLSRGGSGGRGSVGVGWEREKGGREHGGEGGEGGGRAEFGERALEALCLCELCLFALELCRFAPLARCIFAWCLRLFALWLFVRRVA
eukprot:10513-Rhodomonas_salina.1